MTISIGPTPSAGQNVAALRKARGWSQSRLARTAGISPSYLTKIERGDRAATPSVVGELARALHVSTARIYGQPYAGASEQRDLLDALRRVVRRRAMPRLDAGDPAELAPTLRHAEKLRAETRYLDLLRMLPAFIERATAHALDHPTEPHAWEMVADAYSCAYSATHRLAQPELSDLVVSAQTWAASQCWNAEAVAVAAWNGAGLFQTEGEYHDGLAVVDQAVSRFERSPEQDTASGRHTLGSLHLRGVVLASRARDRDATARHLREAHRLAEGMPADVLRHNLTFGPGNVALYELATWIEDGQPARAAEVAAPLLRRPPRGLEPSRIGRLAVDAARASLAARRPDDAAAALAEAHRVSPEMAQVHPMAREVLRVLLVSHQRSRGDLMQMAHRSGLMQDI